MIGGTHRWLWVCAVAVIVGCERPSPVSNDTSATATGSESLSTLTILFESDDYILGPARDDTPKFLMFERLVRGYGTKATPGLAERWEHSDDFHTWTFHLRDDVRWHDGIQVTAHDVAFTLGLFRHPAVKLHGFAHLIDKIAVPDNHTLELTFTRPTGPEAALSGWPVFYPKHLLQDFDPEEFFAWDFWTHPIGNGPYRYVRGVPNTMIELEANPDYFEGEPPIDRVVLRLSTANMVTELLSGNVDAAYYVKPADVPKLAADPRFRLYFQWITAEPQAIHWNHRHPFLADALVRRALSHAVDRREIARVLGLPDEMPLVGGLSPDDRAPDLYREGRLDPGFAFDPSLAARLLSQQGWVDSDGDDVREREGIPARFTFLARQDGILATLELAVLLQDQLRAVGVEMEILPVESTPWHPRFRAGDFDAIIHDVRNVPGDLLREDFFGDGTRIGYRNPEVVQLLEALVLELDPASQDALYSRINEILVRDVPVTFLFPYYEVYVAHRDIHGLRTPERPEPIGAIMDLWIQPYSD